MAPPAGTLRVGRYFLALLAILAILYAIVFWPGQRHTPKLGLDLKGGTQVIFTAKTLNGKTPSSSSMQQAKSIMEERVNGTGVTQATVVIQGSDQIVVSIPGSTNTDVSKLGAAAVLNFRGVVAPAVPVTCTPASATSSATPSAATSPSSSTTPSSPAGASPSPSQSTHDAGHRLLTPLAASATPSATPKATPKTTPTPSASATTPAATPCSASPFAALTQAGVKIPTSDTAYGQLPSAQRQAISAALAKFDCSSGQDEKDDPNAYFVACDSPTAGYAYLLGPVIVAGREIAGASAVAPNVSQGVVDWTVQLDLTGSGQGKWATYTSKHNINGATPPTGGATACGASTAPCADYVAFTLDGLVISAPVNVNAINGGPTQISGGFTPSSSKTLANQLKYGALPLTFKPEQAETVSATLGTSQLKSGLLAGGIGLVLVVIYSLIYYRALGLVTISSLLVSGLLTYGALVMLATQIGFTLSLAGIAGFIVAVGITADSFVVFFERIKDEVHEGRSARVAIPRAWTRARRTILSADTVSFLAAAILYNFAAGDVKGFAFTLGLSTILDLVVVFLFTHPLVSLLSRLRAFGSRRFTGLDAVREGGIAPGEPVEPRRRVVRAERAAKSPGTLPAEPAASPARESGAVIVLDEPEPEPEPASVEDDAPTATGDAEDAVEPTEAPAGEPAEEPVDEPAAESAADAADEPAERRRVPPASGSAAERAAARRARLREKGDS